MPVTEKTHAGEFIVQNPAGAVTHEEVTVLSGRSLAAAAVLGRLLRTLAAAPDPSVSGTGNGTMTNVKLGPRGKVGNYVVTCTATASNGGTFSVVDPDGNALPNLVLTAGSGVATNYETDQLSFTVTDGSTDFAEGDSFTVAVTADGTPTVVGTGNGTIGSISMGPQVENGTYRVEITATATDGGTFEAFDPNGESLGEGAVGTAFASEQINFTVSDGSTDFADGDYFHIAVARPADFEKVVAWDPTTYDGRDRVAGVLFDAVDASSADTDGAAVTRGPMLVDESLLAYSSAITAAQKVAAVEQLKALEIIAR